MFHRFCQWRRKRGKGESLIADPEGNIIQKADQRNENLIAMIDLDAVQKSRDYGIAGVSRPLASFFHEKHRFDYQSQPFEKSAVYGENKLDKTELKHRLHKQVGCVRR
ncbi:hypothetical protein QUF90_27605 [Desulfococcaceae bacterium HSG9]|nr:hypothetical protein [Desulfococcaceae bacterium HSG9]